MSRRRKCCCCADGDSEIVGVAPDDSGAWDLGPYRSRYYGKYNGRFWDVSQGSNVRARGRLSSEGTLAGLPDSVTFSQDQGQAVLRVRCSGICGEPDYFGEVIATNAGVDEPWDISFLKDRVAPSGVWNGWWCLRIPCGGYTAPGAPIGRISAAGEYLGVPGEPLSLEWNYDGIIRRHYAEIVAVCGASYYSGQYYPIIPDGLYPKYGGEVSKLYGIDSLASLYALYDGAPGAFPPGSNVRIFRSCSASKHRCSCGVGQGDDGPGTPVEGRVNACPVDQCADSIGRVYFGNGHGRRLDPEAVATCGIAQTVVQTSSTVPANQKTVSTLRTESEGFSIPLADGSWTATPVWTPSGDGGTVWTHTHWTYRGRPDPSEVIEYLDGKPDGVCWNYEMRHLAGNENGSGLTGMDEFKVENAAYGASRGSLPVGETPEEPVFVPLSLTLTFAEAV